MSQYEATYATPAATGGERHEMAEEANSTTENTAGENAGQETANGSGAEKMFSQDEVNKIIKGRSERELQKMLGEIGFQSVDELKTLVKQKKEHEEAEKSELQKAQDRAAALEKEKEALLASQKTKATQYDVAVKAAKLGIVDPDAAYRLMDQGKIEFEEDGSPKNTEALLQDLVKNKPYLVGSGSSAANAAKSHIDAADKVILEARKGAGLT